MNKFNDTFSVIMAIIYKIARFIVPILPFVMIGGNFFFRLAMISVGLFFPITTPIFWIWGLVCAIKGVQDFWAIMFYVSFVLFFIPFFITFLINMFSKK